MKNKDDYKVKISQIKTAFPVISCHLTEIKRRAIASKKLNGEVDGEIIEELKRFEPLLKEIERLRKRIVSHHYYFT